MVKLKELLKESLERKFGEPLATLDSVMNDYQLGKLYTDKDKPPFKTEKQIQEELNEDGHTDVPSSVRKLKTSIEDANEIIGKLQSMSDEQPLPSWWSDKITLSANYLNKARDYILNPNESVNEELNSSAYSQLSRSIKAIAINIKDLAKAHKKQDDGVVRNEIDNLLYDVKRMVNIIGNKKYNESVNERSNPSDKKELLRALKNSKVADAFSLNNDELVIEMTSPSGTNFVVGNIRKYKGD